MYQTPKKIKARETIGDSMIHHSIRDCIYSCEGIQVNSELLTAIAELRAIYWQRMSPREREVAERERVREEALLRRRAEQNSDSECSENSTEDEESEEERPPRPPPKAKKHPPSHNKPNK